MKLVILGGGPGGYVAAIKAAQAGLDVTIVEKEYFGGTCLNVGCIPTKVLLNTVDIYHMLLKDGDEFGIKCENLSVDWNALQARKSKVVKTLVRGVQSLLCANKVEILCGKGTFITRNSMEVEDSEGKKDVITFDKAIIATGSVPVILPIPGIEGENILTSSEMLSLESLPESICIVGGGVIGSEFASIYARLGVKVTIVEMLPEIISNMDRDIVKYLVYELKNLGVEILTGTKVEKFESSDERVKIYVSSGDGEKIIESEKVLLSIGRKPVVDNLGLETIGVKVDRAITVNENMETNVDNIYAVGDCIGGVMLAHVASAEGVVAVESILKKRSKMDFKTVPYCVYTKPELASVGMTEREAKEAGIDYSLGCFPLRGNGKSLILGETHGLVKYIADNSTGEIIGIHIAGPKATELIVAGSLAIRLEATVDEVLSTIHGHPTVAESLQEAAHAVFGQAIHMPTKNQNNIR
ncbi:dihydrolipoamide dehydrogenase [Dethiosulfatibacter aminovorans DSM 17477]|uniref:Dihydrolipoyl dehydrogenase n=1 Tax=Dethiosulfatibacter aminovorans DSM 17477 TaxID=1121476 RepID=A0A1M6F1V4_9FIRM|nr:dihydrolipoyl dehydrogenase [Dethiosulfatibacter aminovorans]SHI91698.1 dihydrolipoamide dehydrogenase [Dethiosulfatibacter aminovorans DSM 17477]